LNRHRPSEGTRGWSPPHYLYATPPHGARGESRTLTVRVLSPPPLPVGLRARERDAGGETRTHKIRLLRTACLPFEPLPRKNKTTGPARLERAASTSARLRSHPSELRAHWRKVWESNPQELSAPTVFGTARRAFCPTFRADASGRIRTSMLWGEPQLYRLLPIRFGV
jgi:hypothetical protein